MSRTPRTNTNRPRLRSAAAICAVSACATVGVAGADVAEAGRAETASPEIAAEAQRALSAFERWETDRNPADYLRYVSARGRAAEMTARRLGVDEAELSEAWAATRTGKQHAVLAAMSQLGVPYRRYESEPGVAFDCSGLTVWAFATAGLDIPRSSRAQYRAATDVDRSDAEPGDLVYYPGHISMYLGEGTVVHAPSPGGHVEAVEMSSGRSVDFADPFD